MKKTFVFPKRVFLTDTNAEGNVYFARYFDWQGMAREEFFRINVPDHMQILQAGIRLITVHAWMTFKQSAYLFDEILIDVKTTHLKRMSLELVFTFIHKASGKTLGYGGEKLSFSNGDGSLIRVPNSISENAKSFLIEANSEATEIYEKMRSGKSLQIQNKV